MRIIKKEKVDVRQFMQNMKTNQSHRSYSSIQPHTQKVCPTQQNQLYGQFSKNSVPTFMPPQTNNQYPNNYSNNYSNFDQHSQHFNSAKIVQPYYDQMSQVSQSYHQPNNYNPMTSYGFNPSLEMSNRNQQFSQMRERGFQNYSQRNNSFDRPNFPQYFNPDIHQKKREEFRAKTEEPSILLSSQLAEGSTRQKQEQTFEKRGNKSVNESPTAIASTARPCKKRRNRAKVEKKELKLEQVQKEEDEQSAEDVRRQLEEVIKIQQSQIYEQQNECCKSILNDLNERLMVRISSVNFMEKTRQFHNFIKQMQECDIEDEQSGIMDDRLLQLQKIVMRRVDLSLP